MDIKGGNDDNHDGGGLNEQKVVESLTRAFVIEENLQIPVDVGTILSGGERYCLHGRRS